MSLLQHSPQVIQSHMCVCLPMLLACWTQLGPLVQGQGVVQPDKLKKAADPVRQAANMVSSMLGGSNSSEYNSHMLRSNRQGFATLPWSR